MSKIRPVQVILVGFLAVILVGSVLLTLPIAAKNGQATPYIDALFTSTTSVCVTGLVVETTMTHWSYFGQFIIMILIQLGGLGVITIMTGMLMLLGRKVTLRDRILIQESYGLNDMTGLRHLVKRIFIGTSIVEGIGAVLMATQFIPEFGVGYGIWASVFNSISAFCNAGMDIVQLDSMRSYVFNPVINFTIMGLIVVGGLGFVVWRDCVHVLKDLFHKKYKIKRAWTKISLHSKIVLTYTAALILVGTILVFIFEFHNPKTMGDFTIPQKLMASLFQSITTRTAGFETIAQGDLSDGTSLISMILMFIGGSPTGTAGGVKTITFAIMVGCVFSVIKENGQIRYYKRGLHPGLVPKALTIICVNLTVLLTTVLLLLVTNDASFMDTFYESTSALATVGLSKGMTADLNGIGKAIVIFTMYIGRVGPLSMALGFATRAKKKQKLAKYPEQNIILG